MVMDRRVHPRLHDYRVGRRKFMALLAGAAAVGSRAGFAQQKSVPTIGYLSSKGPDAEKTVLAPIVDSLRREGFVDGRSISIIYRWSEGHYDRLPKQSADLVALKASVIVASGLPATLAAKSATTTIPIIFRMAVDPVAFHLVDSLNRPGGNITGVTMLFDVLTPKKLELLHELVPAAKAVGFLVNPKNRNVESHRRHFTAAAQSLGVQPVMLEASLPAEIEAAFKAGRQTTAQAILVGDDPFFDVQNRQITAAAARSGIPTMYYVRDFVETGGLISYGPNFAEMAHQVGDYAARILKGANPADLPVAQPTKYELVINLKTANALGLRVPPSLLARANEILE